MQYPGRLIKKGEQNTIIVKAIQTQLNSKGLGTVVIDGDFGLLTERLVKLFQTRNRDSMGNNLIADGIIGAISWEALFRTSDVINYFLEPLNTAAIEFAITKVGIMEDPVGSNSGLEVNKYLNSVNVAIGEPWCMAFVYYCYDQAAIGLGVSNPLVKTGGCLDQWQQTTCFKIKSSEAINNPSLVKLGSVFIIDHGGGLGHTGIVINVTNGYITTIEGNTNNNNSREGIGVFKNIRKINTINKGFIIV